MKFALHVTSIVLENVVYESLNGFGEGRLTWQREGLPFASYYLEYSLWSCRWYLFTLSLNISDYHHLKRQLESELVEGADRQLPKSFLELPKAEQQLKLKERLKKYCQKVCLFLAMPLTIQVYASGQFWNCNLFFCRHIKEYLTNQLLSFEKQGSVCGKTLFMLTLYAG